MANKIENGQKLNLNIKVYEGDKFIKELSHRNFEFIVGENQIHPDIDAFITKKGWSKKYSLIVDFSNHSDEKYNNKILKFDILNLSMRSINKKIDKKDKLIQELKVKLEESVSEFKLLGEKFVALEEINDTLRTKVRELSNKINANKRITAPQEEIDRIKQYAMQKFFEDFANPYATLKIAVDSGLNTPDSSVQTYVGGFKMVLSMIENVFGAHGLKIVSPEIGSVFDPSTQKVLDFEVNNDVEANTILKVNSAAYLLHDRVIKPALVILSKKS
ncbi:heat shock chaperone GrpE [Mycoplasmopsis californica]|uniref:Protein GrpE n=1 Tax=Mycoplasmopsis californica TaxID=2113 RepID=A0A059XVY2_9BACT|nr:nucleotide exchange factor GrpE [Mycoplasmopsis californica]AIA29407.1 heat shock chaperone GrpE [Mycoplasmopsis californica]